MRGSRRVLAAGVLAAGLVTVTVWAASDASAHVTVTAPGATRGGGDQEITFRVPVEKSVDTVGLRVQLPTATPLATVDVLPVPGWTHTQKSVTLAKPIVTDDGKFTEAVSEVDWTADPGQGLKPGEFGAFTIIAGQLPDTPTLTFKAIQLYSDGSQVDWTQVEAPGSTADLDNPAPVLTLATASDSSDGSSATASPSAAAAAEQPSAPAKSSSNTVPVVLGVIALLIALVALGVAVRPRKPAS